MTERITEILQLLPAHDLFFTGGKKSDDPIYGYEPVVMFALVSVYDDENPEPGMQKKIVALDRFRYSQIWELVGQEYDDLDVGPTIMHRVQVDQIIIKEARSL